jgi:dephospho-CoA kinase
MIVGLTGGICCGKSVASKIFIRNGIPEVDADIVARQLVEPGTYGHHQIYLVFGEAFFLENGELNRPKLGKEVFLNPEKLNILNEIMCPLISKESDRQLKELASKYPICIYNAALIIENGNADKYRPLIVVGCSKENQLARLMARNDLTVSEAMSRIAVQMPFDKKEKFADFVINTDGSIENSFNRTLEIIQLIKLELEIEKGNVNE